MRKRTIKEVIKAGNSLKPSPEHYEIYLVRADGLVLYVGKGRNAYNRFLFHLGFDSRGAISTLGECIKANIPRSHAWWFEEYTLEDCRDITLARRKEMYGETDESVPLYTDEVEEAMIKHSRPPLNTAANPNPRPLPAEYEWRDLGPNPFAEALADLLGLE